jgi:hypothetical protein
MVYFDIFDSVKMLPDVDRGRLFMAMLEYGRDGVVPEFDGMLGIMWTFIQPKIDRDEENYDASKLQRQYAAFCKKRKKIWMPRILFEDWVLMSEDERQRAVDPVASRNERQRPVESVNERNPSNIYSNNSSEHPSAIIHHPSTVIHQPSSISHHQAAAAVTANTTADGDLAAAAADRQLKCMSGELGKGVVFLTDEQVDDLLDRMGLDAFDHYVDKLSNFILKNNARVASHYDTIQKWWMEDSGLKGR